MVDGLKLAARDGEDIAVISAMLQDAVIAPEDMTWLERDGCFILVASRFRWEVAAAGGRPSFQRVHASLTFRGVSGVQQRGPDLRRGPAESRSFLCLLAMMTDGSSVLLRFAGGSELRLTCDAIDCRLTDLDEPWPTAWLPVHETDMMPDDSLLHSRHD